MSEFSDDLKQRCQPLLADVEQLTSQCQRLQYEVAQLQQRLADHNSRLGWRERYAGGWFGGDTSAAQQLRQLKGSSRTKNDEISHLQRRCSQLGQKLDKLIEPELKQTDATYQRLVRRAARHAPIVRDCDEFIKQLRATDELITAAKVASSWYADSLLRRTNAQQTCRCVKEHIQFLRRQAARLQTTVKPYTNLSLDRFRSLPTDFPFQYFGRQTGALQQLERCERSLPALIAEAERARVAVKHQAQIDDHARQAYLEAARSRL